ncbi:MAG: serine/threonine protein kinase [Myxococcales bacterium]|nr:serine/threonine protein kinase [Myxococcales bacterium]
MTREGLQRYQIMEPLGQGSQGHTFRAIDRESGDTVAVKVLQLAGAGDWKAFDLFEREVAVLRGLDHPGIPRFRDTFSSEGSGDYFLVMDLVEGQTLAELMKIPGRFDEASLRAVMLGILDILEYLHSRTPPVIHRDIKPANLILGGRPERITLVDFGGVRLARRREGGSTMIGTFGYMAPEQLHGDAGPKVDLYALGATIVSLATGLPADELPHEGLAIDLDQLQLPASLRPVLAALLAPDPRERTPSVAAALELVSLSPRDDWALRSDPGGVQAAPQLRKPVVPETSSQLVVPDLLQELAETRRPLSIVVWLAAMLGTAGLLVFEYALLPVIFLVMRAAADDKRKHGRTTDDDEARMGTVRDLRRTVSRQRQLAQYVVQSTSPLRDDDGEAPPPPSGSAGGELERGRQRE